MPDIVFSKGHSSFQDNLKYHLRPLDTTPEVSKLRAGMEMTAHFQDNLEYHHGPLNGTPEVSKPRMRVELL